MLLSYRHNTMPCLSLSGLLTQVQSERGQPIFLLASVWTRVFVWKKRQDGCNFSQAAATFVRYPVLKYNQSMHAVQYILWAAFFLANLGLHGHLGFLTKYFFAQFRRGLLQIVRMSKNIYSDPIRRRKFWRRF